jgi:hypothetical protein
MKPNTGSERAGRRMTVEEYFTRPDTPMAGSPVGVLMIRVVEKNPGIDFDSARVEAFDLLKQAAGRRHYRVPSVLSPTERAESEAKIKERFKTIRRAA